MMTLNEELQSTYVLLDEIGSGGGGTVFKAYHKRLQKEVVLKKIHRNLTGGNIRAEADILKNLKSEYLPQVLDFFELDGDVYTVMDFIPGGSLKEPLKEGQKFGQNQVLKWMDQLCRAVEKLHEQNPPIIHGDIKPDNIMLTPENNICLIDFNVSGDFENTDVAGFTPGYASPEQVSNFNARKARAQAERAAAQAAAAEAAAVSAEKRYVGSDATEVMDSDETEVIDPDATEVVESDETEVMDSDETEVAGSGAAGAPGGAGNASGNPNTAKGTAGSTSSSAVNSAPLPRIPVDVRSDIYSMGATVYHLLTGEKPGVDKVKPIWEYPVKVDDSFAYLIMKCLEKDPNKRYQSVAELHKAVLNVHKSGKRYKALLFRQFLIRMILAVGVVGFAGLAAAGRMRMRREEQEQYQGIIVMEKQAREQGDHEEVMKRFEEAVALAPEKGEAYLEVLRSLYQQKRYDETIEFMDREVIYSVTESDVMGEIYLIYGNSYLEVEQYSQAADAFTKAIFFDSTNALYYQDYAIALARLGQTEEASYKLEQAVRYGLGNDRVYYTQGEIAWALEDFTGAWDGFYNCIATTEDEYMKMRAYLMCSRILGQQEQTEEIKAADIALLEEAVQNTAREYSSALLERLAQAYIDMGGLTGDGGYDMQAVAVLEKIAEYGWATYTTYQNMVLLYQKNGMYQEGLDLLQTMLKLFGENYNTYKRMAFLEAGQQSQIENENRDYGYFEEYYNKAASLYAEQLSGNQTDVEMMALQKLYDQAVQGGWIGR